ncbi:hypothetical protein HY990_07385 [Candidatus Micrarchaeota archaeon]|nr:hypothetical protein [Candidatus Micrarchaeota archaeon]
MRYTSGLFSLLLLGIAPLFILVSAPLYFLPTFLSLLSGSLDAPSLVLFLLSLLILWIFVKLHLHEWSISVNYVDVSADQVSINYRNGVCLTANRSETAKLVYRAGGRGSPPELLFYDHSGDELAVIVSPEFLKNHTSMYLEIEKCLDLKIISGG